MARVRDHDCLTTIRSLVTPGDQQGHVTSERLPLLRSVCLLGAPPAGLLQQEDWRPLLFGELVAGGEQISDGALRERQASVTPFDPAMMLYTSGTTGSPKGALLTHHGLLNNAQLMAQRWGPKQDMVICVLVPFFHAMGSVSGTLAALYLGCPLHPLLAFDPLKALQIISRERCTFFGAIPTMLMAIMQHPDFSNYDLSSLKLIGSGGASVPLALLFRSRLALASRATSPRTPNYSPRQDGWPGKTVTAAKTLPPRKSDAYSRPFPFGRTARARPL